ncbi:MAG: class I SAM-dependent methyltransferase [Alphaproteobacteria bacterium]|nr:class I SAM-dependent methyltransferase [Alphaproteobacteria bacterium]
MGCGHGRDSLYFLDLSFDVIGIDVSEKVVALAQRIHHGYQSWQRGIGKLVHVG